MGRSFSGNGRMVTVAVERGRVGIARRAPAGRRGTEPGGSAENPSYWKGGGSTSVETVTQRPVVGVEGRRAVVGREGSPALVGLGTSVLGFRVGRRRLAVVYCQTVVICGSLFGCRGAFTREKPTSVGRILVFANGVSVSPRLWKGLRGWRSWRGTKIPWGSVFKHLLSTSELVRRCQSCGP